MSRKRTQSSTAEPTVGAAPAGLAPAEAAEGTALNGTRISAGTRQAGEEAVSGSGVSKQETRRPTKASLLQQRLARPEGATMADLMQATGWQAHTVRAALTRLRQAGHAVERSRSNEGGTVYRISQPRLSAEQEPAPADEPAGAGSASRSGEGGVRLRVASGEASETASTDRSTDPDEALAT